MQAGISDRAFGQFQRWLADVAGIHLSPAKKVLVASRLSKRLREHRLEQYEDYFSLLEQDDTGTELQCALDLLTTNETYFFREPRHFELLHELAGQHGGNRPFRVWSGACSSGEEPYSIAMVLDDALGDAPWDVVGTDINAEMIDKARAGLYRMVRTDLIPPGYLRKYCLKGTGAYQGMLLVNKALKSRVRLSRLNINAELPEWEPFDVIFLRNVMIYFGFETKRALVHRLIHMLRPGGYLLVGHSESLNGVSSDFVRAGPSLYRKPD